MIDKISNFTCKSFLNYTNPENLLFKQKNLFFGYNGRGKSSLAKGIEKEIKRMTSDSEEVLRIFSSDYMTLKLINDSTSRLKGIKAVFGNKNVNNDEQIDLLKQRLVDTKPLLISVENLKKQINQVIKATEDSIKGKIKLRRQIIEAYPNVDELINVFKQNYAKALAITNDEKLDTINGNYDFEKEQQEVKSLRQINISIDEEMIKKCNAILAKEYTLEKIPSIELLDWLKKGIELNKGSKKCLFCGSDLNDVSKIEKHYDEYIKNEKQKDITFFKESIFKLEDVHKEIELFLEETKKYKKVGIDVSEEESSFNTLRAKIDAYLVVLHRKCNEFEKGIAKENEVSFADDKIEDKCLAVSRKKTDKINLLTKEENKINDLVKGLIGKKILDNRDFKKDISDYRKAIKDLDDANNSNNKIIGEIKKIKDSISVFDSFASFINGILSDLDIKFKLEIIDNDYRILPANEGDEIKIKDISEGERNLLSFLFFYYELFEDLNNLSIKEKIEYVIIDDPVSSLDENNKTYIESILKSLVSLENIQLFIMTHDWSSFCDILYPHKGKELRSDDSKIRAFEIKKDSDSHSFLSFANPTISPYEHDFFELIDVKENKNADSLSDTEIYHLPNCMRRVLETFLAFKADNYSPTDNNFETIKQVLYNNKECTKRNEMALHTALTVMNANSHKPARNSTDVYNSLKYIVNTINAADEVHFNMIKSKKSKYNQTNEH